MFHFFTSSPGCILVLLCFLFAGGFGVFVLLVGFVIVPSFVHGICQGPIRASFFS